MTAFQQRRTKTRRADLIEQLLKHEDYARNWANLWTVWLLTRTSPPGVNREALRLWLKGARLVPRTNADRNTGLASGNSSDYTSPVLSTRAHD